MDINHPSSHTDVAKDNIRKPTSHPDWHRDKFNKFKKVNVSVKLVIVLLMLIVVVLLGSIAKNVMPNTSGVNKNEYQAVFLSNGQVYFGHISRISYQRYELNNIYYLQNQQANGQQAQVNNNQNVTLVKLGNELHGPEDKMYIEHSQVLFWENLKDSSKVVQAIKNNNVK